MKQKILQSIRTLLVTFIMGVAVVAVVHFDNSQDITQVASTKTSSIKPDWRQMYPVPEVADLKSKSHVEKELRARMAEDDILGKNPFQGLNVPDALEKAIHGASAFERQTLRSPSYHEDAGYDLVHYEIMRADGSLAQILAYVSGDESTEGKIVVMILSPEGERSEYALFQDGNLSESRTLASDTGIGVMNERLASGVPFLSVSR